MPADGEGQVSEASSMADATEPIQPDQSVAGAPNDEDVQEGKTGPNARTGNDGDNETGRDEGTAQGGEPAESAGTTRGGDDT